jgi:hypothetical protein
MQSTGIPLSATVHISASGTPRSRKEARCSLMHPVGERPDSLEIKEPHFAYAKRITTG